MQTVTNANFGPLIAYLVPGATALWGLSEFSPTIRTWFAVGSSDSPTISGFLYLTIASLAVGMTITAIRWVVVDRVHAITGLRPPALDFSRLPGRVDAYALLIDIHYRHFQYYANMSVATLIAYLCHRIASDATLGLGWIDFGFVGLEAVFVTTSRDTLSKYYVRTQQLLATNANASATPGDREAHVTKQTHTTCGTGEPFRADPQTPAATPPVSSKPSAAE